MTLDITIQNLHFTERYSIERSFPGGSVVKESACQCRLAGGTGDTGSIPGSGRYSGGGNGNPFQYSCLGNPMDRGSGGLQSMGPQRVGHNQVTEHACTHSIERHVQAFIHHLLLAYYVQNSF